jgi:hypothetical protein
MLRAPDVSQHGRMREALGRVGVPAVAVALALVLLGAVVVAALQSTTASAATVLQRGGGAVAELSDGSVVALTVGDEVPRGATVRAGRDGAVLRTRGRDTWLGGNAQVTVVDGARQRLRFGLVMVDARRGPALALTTAAAEVTTPGGAVSRVEDGGLVRVGAYSGDAVDVRAADRQTTVSVAPLYQVQVAEGRLPGRTTPLVLTPGDPYERALAMSLVAADEALDDIASRIDADARPGTVVLEAVAADVPAAAAPAPGAPRSEQALAYLLARAAEGDALDDRYATVRGLRDDGGSWGVVAAIVSAEVSEVAGLLDVLLAPASEPVLAGDEPGAGAPSLADLLAGDVPADGSAGSDGSGDGDTAPPSGPPPSGPPPSDEPPPPPPPGPVDTVTETVEAVVDTVLGLLPEPPTSDDPTTTTDPALPVDPTPSPSPSPSPGLLDPVLG